MAVRREGIEAVLQNYLPIRFNWLGKHGWKAQDGAHRLGFKDTALCSAVTSKHFLFLWFKYDRQYTWGLCVCVCVYFVFTWVRDLNNQSPSSTNLSFFFFFSLTFLYMLYIPRNSYVPLSINFDARTHTHTHTHIYIYVFVDLKLYVPDKTRLCIYFEVFMCLVFF